MLTEGKFSAGLRLLLTFVLHLLAMHLKRQPTFLVLLLQSGEPIRVLPIRGIQQDFGRML